MKTPMIVGAALAMGFSSLLLAQNGGQGRQAGQMSEGARTGQMGQMGQSGQSQENPAQEQQEFVNEAASGNQMEIQLGQFVASHTQNPQVKQLAQSLVQDHQQAQQKLKQAAQQAGVSVSDQLTPVQQAKLQEMEKKSGKDLDRAFAFSAVADHHKDLLEYTYASQNLQSPQLKQYASQCIPTLQQHYQSAEGVVRAVTGIQDQTTASGR